MSSLNSLNILTNVLLNSLFSVLSSSFSFIVGLVNLEM